MRRQQALTLIELLVAIAVATIVLMIAVPPFFDYMLVKRLKSVNSEVLTDMNLARSEAVSRNAISRVVFNENTALTCYTIFTNPIGTPATQRCNCLLGTGAACSGTNPDPLLASAEIKTVQVLRSSGLTVTATHNGLPGNNPAPGIAFSNLTGGLMGVPTDPVLQTISDFNIETAASPTRMLRVIVGRTGRTTVCSVGAHLGAATC
jgi:type IV fimbrial biogenesis protein FimT